jgi:predicted PurR-regulated permease PerM
MFGIDVRTARAVWTAVVIAVLLYCVYAVRTTLLVMLFAVFFSYLVYPLVETLQRRLPERVPRAAVAAVVFAGVIGLVVLAAALFGNRIASEASGLGQQLPKLLEPSALAQRVALPRWLEPFRDRLAELVRSLLQSGQGQALPAAQRLGAGIVHAAGNLVYAIVVPIFSFLMIVQAPAIEGRLLSWLDGKRGGLWSSLVHDLNFLLARYVRALGVLSLAALVVYGAALSLLGAPFALLLASLAAVLEVVPVAGPLAAAVAIVLVALFTGYPHVWWLIAFVIVYRIFQDYMLNPYLMSEGVNVPPILVVFGLLAGEELAGVAGIFLSVPFIAAARIVAHRVRAHLAGSSV